MNVRNDTAERNHLVDVPGIGQPDVKVFTFHNAPRDGRIHVVFHVDFDPVLTLELR
jgi:hypothetical protein